MTSTTRLFSRRTPPPPQNTAVCSWRGECGEPGGCAPVPPPPPPAGTRRCCSAEPTATLPPRASRGQWESEIELRHVPDNCARCTCSSQLQGYGSGGSVASTTSSFPDWETVRLAEIPPPPGRPLRRYGAADCGTLGGHTITPIRSALPGPGERRRFVLRGSSESLAGSDSDTSSDKVSRLLEGRGRCLGCLLLLLLVMAGAGVVLPVILKVRRGSDDFHRPTDHLQLVKKMLKEVPLIDGHNDLAWNIRNFIHNRLAQFNFSADLRQVPPWSLSSWSQTDLPRLQRGLLGGQFWSAYVPCESQHRDAVQLTLEQVNVIRRLVASYPAQLGLATSADEIEREHSAGRVASLIGVEGGHSIGNSLGVLRAMYDLGVRYLTLTHTCDTPWADSSVGANADLNLEEGGLTAFGETMVHEMNRLGMIVDLSHASGRTVRATLKATRSPIIFSHSGARALCNSTRNVPDSVLHALKENGGIVMVSFYNDFLTCSLSARMEDVMRHVTHIRDVAGEDHVGIGAGYEGINRVPTGLEDVSRYPYLLAELARTRGWTIPQLEKLAGRNLLRVFRQVEKVRDDMQRLDVPPYEDWIPPADLKGADKDGCQGGGR